MTRMLGTAPLVVLLALGLGLSGCDGSGSGGSADRAAVDEVEQQADAALDGVLHDVAAALRLDGAQGSRSFTICGESYAPRGVVMQSFVHFDASGELTREKATATTVGLLEDDGWTVDDPDNTVILKAAKGRLVLHVQIGPSLVQVDLVSECVETSDAVAEEYADRPTVDLAWS
ncbi:hypothetical protein [Nocardioides humi]|nr:hypothetical protein [Nocardioides humi]